MSDVEWHEARLSDLCSMSSGKTRSPQRDGPYPLFGSNGLIGHAPQSLADSGIIVGRVGAYCGSLQFSPGPFWATDNTIVLRNGSHIDLRFLFFALCNAQLPSLAGGAAQPLINQRHLQAVQLRVPGRVTQARIATALATFNELIELHERRIDLLEDLARSIYREWFESGRYPGRTAGETGGRDRGDTPVGWRPRRLRDLADVVTNGVELSEVAADERYVGLEHLPRRKTTLARWGYARDVSSRKLRFAQGDTLFGKIRPYFHKVVWAPFDGVSSSDIIVIRPRGRARGLVNTIAASDRLVAHVAASANGTKMPRANVNALLDFELLLPDDGSPVLERFEHLLTRVLSQASALVLQISRLTATRDLLLPRLVTGRLDISEIDLGDLLDAEAA